MTSREVPYGLIPEDNAADLPHPVVIVSATGPAWSWLQSCLMVFASLSSSRFPASLLSDIIKRQRQTHRIAPLAQLDRASGYEPEGREFESLRARHSFLQLARNS